MDNSRKFRVWLISMGAVLAVYLLYSLISKTPRIEIDTDFTDTFADGNSDGFGDKVGKIGKIGIGNVQKAEYIHLNEQKQVDRVLGFDRLFHKTENEYEGIKPYLNIFRRDLGCYITADRAEVRVETVLGKPTPKDAKFKGNVVAHIVPENSSDVKEGFLYLDDVTFISDTSQFLTPGPVKYVSQDVRMLGSGLELIYNEQLQRIEFLRVLDLDSAGLKSTQSPFFPTDKAKPHKPPDPNSKVQPRQPEKTVAPAQKEAERYRCVFSKNVVVDSPEQLIFASEKLSVTNIFRPEDSEGQSDKADPNRADKVAITAADGAPNTENKLEPNSPDSPNSLVIEEKEPVEIVVTCDRGLVITPMDIAQADTNSALISLEQLLTTAREKLKQSICTIGRSVFISQRIDFSASTRDTIATGPSELTFYTDDLVRTEPNATVVPVKISARRKAQFLPLSNQALFEGDCQCRMQREDANSLQKFALSAPLLTVDLSREKDKRPSASAGTIEHLAAIGPTVRLQSTKTAGDKLLGGFELKCVKFEYDANDANGPFFLAAGPGTITVDNSTISEPNSDAGRFSLRKRCYAVVENFDTLKYLLETNQIIAEAEGRGLIVDYFPIVDGKADQHVTVTAGRVVANLLETPDSRTEISTLLATGGVTYNEKDKEFAGSRLFYDALKAVLTVRGDASNPCIYNGTLVDRIEYDLKTGNVKFQIVGPGVIQRKR
ncbi:MAG: hypothetical protein OEW48_05565 [Phycisphaerae bacterium]|nr:hypothetical protein [Phycisphaerae bacterium]